MSTPARPPKTQIREAVERELDRRDAAASGSMAALVREIGDDERAEELFAAGKGGVRLTRVQADAIGALRLIQLVGLEIEKLASELTELLAKIDELEAILADSARILAIVRADTVALSA